MKNRILEILVILSSFTFLLLLVSCDNTESKDETKNIVEVTKNLNTFNEEYDKKVTFTLKPDSNAYNYKFVYNCRIQIKPKTNFSAREYKLKVSIYDGEVSAFSEEIITRYFEISNSSNIDETIIDVYTNEVLINSAEFTIPSEIGKDYTKNFLNTKKVYFMSFGGLKSDGTNYYESYTFSESKKNFPVQPRKAGYYFDGWYSDNKYTKEINQFADMKDNMVLYAKWEATPYRITYHIDDDVVNPNTITSFTVESEDINLIDPERRGYTFKGWYQNSRFYGEPISSIPCGTKNSIDLYPQWAANKYNVELVYNDGETSNKVIEVYYGNKYELPIPTRDGYIFEGWYLDEDDYDTAVCSLLSGLSNPAVVSTLGNHTLYAKWVQGTKDIYIKNTSEGWVITGCKNTVTTLKIPEKICGKDVVSIEKEAFFNMNQLTKVEMPDTIKSIGESAFRLCSGLTEIKISNNCETIGERAFGGLYNLKNIEIPTSVKSIGFYAFVDCTSVESISVFSFSSSLAYIFGRQITSESKYIDIIPTSVGSTGISVPKSLKKVTITSGKSGDSFLMNCSELIELTLPNTITSFGVNEFEGCTNLENVYFNGSLEEWEKIIQSSDGSTPLAYGAKLYVLENDVYVLVN